MDEEAESTAVERRPSRAAERISAKQRQAEVDKCRMHIVKMLHEHGPFLIERLKEQGQFSRDDFVREAMEMLLLDSDQHRRVLSNLFETFDESHDGERLPWHTSFHACLRDLCMLLVSVPAYLPTQVPVSIRSLPHTRHQAR